MDVTIANIRRVTNQLLDMIRRRVHQHRDNEVHMKALSDLIDAFCNEATNALPIFFQTLPPQDPSTPVGQGIGQRNREEAGFLPGVYVGRESTPRSRSSSRSRRGQRRDSPRHNNRNRGGYITPMDTLDAPRSSGRRSQRRTRRQR